MSTAAQGFAFHAGPIERLGPRAFVMALETRHLNYAGRFHGGMVLTLLSTACGEVARDEALRMGPEAVAELLALDCNFISAALVGAKVRAEVAVVRVTRTVVFLSARVSAGDEVLATASSTFRIGAASDSTWGAREEGDPLAAGWSLMASREPFAQHVGAIYERQDGAAPQRAGFRVDAERLDAHGQGVLHEGMALFVADLFSGRAAVAASGARCVTLGMQVRRFAAAPAGSWVEFEPRVRHVAPAVVFVDGSFSLQGQHWLEVSSIWKVLGAA